MLILDEESVEGAADLPQEQITEPSKKSKGKKNALKIDSSKLDDFDLLAAEPVNASNEEYDIDLEVLRAKLSQTSIDKPKRRRRPEGLIRRTNS